MFSAKIPTWITFGHPGVWNTSKTTKKSYIGQAKCYVKCGRKFKKWGSEKRWQSHIHEANSNKDHNKYLNDDIRKYGREDFELTILTKCELKMLDDKKYLLIQKQVYEIGCMLGGWQRSLN